MCVCVCVCVYVCMCVCVCLRARAVVLIVLELRQRREEEANYFATLFLAGAEDEITHPLQEKGGEREESVERGRKSAITRRRGPLSQFPLDLSRIVLGYLLGIKP